MTGLLLGILACVCLLIVVDGLWRNRPYELPFLAAAITLTFAIPQLIGLHRSPFQQTSDSALRKTLVVSFLCMVMLRIGWQRGCARAVAGAVYPSFYNARLVYWAALLAAVGCWGNWMIRSLPEEVTSGQWSGLPVAYLFFAIALTYAYALSVNIWLRYKVKTALAVIAVTSFVYFAVIVFAGRRQPAAEFVLIPACTLWFVKRKALPRILPVVGMVAMLLFLQSTEEYRNVANVAKQEGTWEGARDIPFVGNLVTILEFGGPELTNAVTRVEAVSQSGVYDFGLSLWNAMVFNYVPRQIVGQDFKQSLMISLPDVEYETLGYVANAGTTWTGFANAFASFWYFGCLMFAFMGWAMGRIYGRACDGDLMAQVVYALMLVNSGLVITHGTSMFFTPWPHLALFLLSGLYWARKPREAGLLGVEGPVALEGALR